MDADELILRPEVAVRQIHVIGSESFVLDDLLTNKPGERNENETTKGSQVSDKGSLNTAPIQGEAARFE